MFGRSLYMFNSCLFVCLAFEFHVFAFNKSIILQSSHMCFLDTESAAGVKFCYLIRENPNQDVFIWWGQPLDEKIQVQILQYDEWAQGWKDIEGRSKKEATRG